MAVEKLLTGKEWKGSGIRLILKEDSPGDFTAEFATLNVIDHDGDVTIPGAFKVQDVKVSAWGHSSWGFGEQNLPIGRGKIHEDDDTMKAVVDGRFFIDTTHGKDAYLTIKALDELQEWSYGFSIVDADFGTFMGQHVRFLKSVDVFEVSPVMRGAGLETRTTRIKGEGMTMLDHSEAVLQNVSEWVTRIEDLAKLRIAKGQDILNDVNVARLRSLKSSLDEAQVSLEELLTMLRSDGSQTEALAALTQFQLLRTQFMEVTI